MTTTSTQRVRASDQRLKDAGGMVIKVRLNDSAVQIIGEFRHRYPKHSVSSAINQMIIDWWV